MKPSMAAIIPQHLLLPRGVIQNFMICKKKEVVERKKYGTASRNKGGEDSGMLPLPRHGFISPWPGQRQQS